MNRIVTALTLLTAGCALLGAQPAAHAGPSGTPPAETFAAAPADAAIAPFQAELLEIAFDAASSLPLRPHVKTRSRLQHEVVETCLELDLPVRALRWADRIDNWHRGAAYADVAMHLARCGRSEDARQLLGAAAKLAEETEDWRRDNIRVRIARAYAWLGQAEKAASYEAGVVDAEAGKVAGARARRGDAESFDEHLRAMDALLASGSFDVVRNTLASCGELYDRFYGDGERRAVVAARMRSAWERMPLFVRIEVLMGMAESALDHADPAGALELAREAQAIFDGAAWQLEHGLPIRARLVALRCRAGDTERCRADADAILADYDADGETILRMFRARAIRPLAEAYHVMGDREASMAVYRRALDAGMANPNSRPRAEDLAATCRSLAVHGIEPDDELWARIREIGEAVVPPC